MNWYLYTIYQVSFMNKKTLELDTLLLIKLHTLSKEDLKIFLDNYNLKYENQVWGLENTKIGESNDNQSK